MFTKQLGTGPKGKNGGRKKGRKVGSDGGGGGGGGAKQKCKQLLRMFRFMCTHAVVQLHNNEA